MAWWTENYHWVLAGIGATLLILFRRWALSRLFTGSWGKPRKRQETDLGSRQVADLEAEDVTVARPRAGVLGGALLKLGLAALTGVLVAAGLLYATALVQGVPIAALPIPLTLAVAGSVAALWSLIVGVYLLGRLAMGRRARQLGVGIGSVASSYQQFLVLSTDPTAALADSRAALLALPQGAALDCDDERPDQVVGRTAKSARSFGEIVRIRVQRMAARRTGVEIRSRPATWQLFDGGINAENVAAIARFLETRAARVERRGAVAQETPAREDRLLTTSDWLALAYLAALAGYCGTLIALKELWPGRFAVLAGWLDAVPLDPLRLMGGTCLAGDPVAGPSIVSQLNILILPTLLAYSAYNTLEFRRKRDRMDALNWILCLGSLIFLPLVVLMGCSELSGSADWAAGLNSKYRALIGFMLEESAGGFLYALLLVVFTNGVSYLPALVLARIFGTEPKS